MDEINELYEYRFPNNNKDFYDSLNENEKGKYLNLYKKYSNMLYKYLIDKLNLLELDDLLKNSKNNFVKIDQKNMDLYQLLGSNYLNYLYIRNNIYIERLNKDELNYLNNLTNYDPNFIENTYLKVCLENTDLTSNIDINYGPDNLEFFKPNNAIIIGLRYNDYDKTASMSNEEWLEIRNKRLLELDILNIAFNKFTNNKLKVKVCLQRYNEFTVYK